jgi:hypothetical protein
MAMQIVVGGLERNTPDGLDPVRLRWWDEVIEQRRPSREALDAEQLLGVERAGTRAMLRVSFVRNVAAADVEDRAPPGRSLGGYAGKSAGAGEESATVTAPLRVRSPPAAQAASSAERSSWRFRSTSAESYSSRSTEVIGAWLS